MRLAYIVVAALAAHSTCTDAVSTSINSKTVLEHDDPLAPREMEDDHVNSTNTKKLLRIVTANKDLQADDEERNAANVAEELKPVVMKLSQSTFLGKTSDVAVAAATGTKALVDKLALQYRAAISKVLKLMEPLGSKLANSPIFVKLVELAHMIRNIKVGDSTMGERFKAAKVKHSFKTSTGPTGVELKESTGPVVVGDAELKAKTGPVVVDDSKLKAGAKLGVVDDPKLKENTGPGAVKDAEVKSSTGLGPTDDSKLKAKAEHDVIEDSRLKASTRHVVMGDPELKPSTGLGPTDDSKLKAKAEHDVIEDSKLKKSTVDVEDPKLKLSAGLGTVGDVKLKESTVLDVAGGFQAGSKYQTECQSTRPVFDENLKQKTSTGHGIVEDLKSKTKIGFGIAEDPELKVSTGPGVVDAAKMKASTGLGVVDDFNPRATTRSKVMSDAGLKARTGPDVVSDAGLNTRTGPGAVRDAELKMDTEPNVMEDVELRPSTGPGVVDAEKMKPNTAPGIVRMTSPRVGDGATGQITNRNSRQYGVPHEAPLHAPRDIMEPLMDAVAGLPAIIKAPFTGWGKSLSNLWKGDGLAKEQATAAERQRLSDHDWEADWEADWQS
uniref:Uncharacterized protein n=1 Tax=Peronospora matthiolae TaxID=2874970 RepID=A0AAV1TDP6_9STRA